ncbi:GGDEF domain-containing protein [Loktanella sp. DJP18]|uniref:GGDEF domain-containing protein n=1 Tax=Loktanella sp. DJP18 TaxID=3409788 RepID=UPI003BB575FD
MKLRMEIVQSALLDLIEATNDAIVITSAEEIERPGPLIVHANTAFCRISGYALEEVLGKSPRVLQGPGTCPLALGRIAASLRAGQECQEELLNYAKDGTPYWLDIHIVPLRDEMGVIRYFGAIERDVTGKRTAVEQLERLALEDILTGIGNRAALHKHMESLSQQLDMATERPFLLLFDLDGFKQINDTLGHLAGDDILRHFAGYVASNLRRDDFMARLGGDEFVAVLHGYTAEAALLFAKNVVANLATMQVSGAESIGVSVGMTDFAPGDEMSKVIAGADRALYRAKDAGKGTVRVNSCPRVA